MHSIRCKRVVTAILLVSSLAWSACAGQGGDTSVKLGQEFNLAPGQTAAIAGEPLKVRFVEVTNDSRCPLGVTCIWEGEVSCLVEITYQDATSSMTLTERGSRQAKADFNDYDITFDVEPYPQAGKQIEKRDYRLLLTIEKKALR